MPTNLITLPHFSDSSAMSLPKPTSEPASAAASKSARRALIWGSARAAFISSFSLSTISGGVFLGATGDWSPATDELIISFASGIRRDLPELADSDEVAAFRLGQE